MKITRINETLPFVNRVREKADSGERSGGHPQDQNSKEQAPKEEPYETMATAANEAQVGAAIHAFGADAQAQAQGLSAQMTGGGPGLRVVLRDGTGAVVRQFTGEEFIKLREAVQGDGRSRGKLLDQKL